MTDEELIDKIEEISKVILAKLDEDIKELRELRKEVEKVYNKGDGV